MCELCGVIVMCWSMHACVCSDMYMHACMHGAIPTRVCVCIYIYIYLFVYSSTCIYSSSVEYSDPYED